jgi:hypothetical protein
MGNLLGYGDTIRKHDEHTFFTKEGLGIFVKEIMDI